MFRGVVLAAALGATLGGCALPQLPPPDRLEVSDIIDAVQCELQFAMVKLRPQHEFLDNWGVGMQLTLVVDERGGISPDLSQVFVGALSTFTLGLHADVNGSAKRTVNFKLAFRVKDLERFECPAARRGDHHPLNSRLGIHEWMERALGAIDKNDVVGDPLSIGTTLQFVLSAGGKISPQLVLTRSRSTPSAVITGTHADDHTLDLTLSPLPKPPKPIEVIVVGHRR